MNKNILFTGFLILLLFGVMIIAHENAHAEVFKSYGIDSEITYFHSWKYVAVTTPEYDCPTDECILANNNVDAFGYQLAPLFGLISLFLLEYVSNNK